MKDLLTFMGEHPFLTFFLVLVVMQGLIYIAQAIFGHKDCDCEDDD